LILGADVGATLQERIEQAIDDVALGAIRRILGRRTWRALNDAELDELAEAVLDVPNVAISASTSKGSPGRALRKRRRPARSGDWTRVRNRVSMSLDASALGPSARLVATLIFLKALTRFRGLVRLSADYSGTDSARRYCEAVMLS
jgi:hypothetical protein